MAKYIPASEHHFFSMFSDILKLFKKEATFPCSGNAFQQVLHPASGNRFSV